MNSNKRYLRKDDATFDGGGTTFNGDLRRRRGKICLGGDRINVCHSACGPNLIQGTE
ncbi:hypothetical protein DEO72_LG5g2312 [Vigna unguiculata]|uniref:Uncharacterized protein n=1 Tax=Vigna unguiculata TaxID=3917 RepID=A0A4D6M114_VIGUN|nr:hypothetical protein DEO72_LG5g2312 [Vigna unguiculata]